MNAAAGEGAARLLLPLLGVVGVLAIVLLPWRVWRLLRGAVPAAWRISLLGRLLAAVATAACIALLFIWMQLLSRAGHCALDGNPCGRVSEWWYLALLGTAYVAFEIACWPLRRALRNIGALGEA